MSTEAKARRLYLHIDEVHDYDGAALARLLVHKPCDETCHPGNCEAAHHHLFG